MNINNGKVKTENNTPPKLPMMHNLIASYPLPSSRSLCPGNTPSTVDSSGAPRRIEGMKLIKELITPDVTKITAVGNGPNKNDKPRIIGIVLLGCKPGNKPAAIPNIVPIAKARSKSNMIKNSN